MSETKIKKFIEAEFEQINKDIEKSLSEIGELYYKTHQISYLNGMELVKSHISEQWIEITDRIIELDTCYAIKSELKSILNEIEKLQQK